MNIRLPNAYITDYPLRNYAAIDNLRRVTDYNRSQMEQWVLRTGYNLNNNHPLVNLLQLLAIDSTWTLDKVVAVARFKTNSVCSLCGITNINRNAPHHTNVFYQDTKEMLFAVYNDTEYVEENLNHDFLISIIPTYINDAFVDYNASIERTSNGYREKDKFAFIGIDVVALAVGWWFYMRTHTGQGTGIHAYLVNYPLRNASLVHNQLNIINSLYAYTFESKPFAESVAMEDTSFFVLEEDNELRKYLMFLDNTFTGKRIVHVDQLLKQIYTVYSGSPFCPYALIANNPGMVKRLSSFNNLRWVLDAMILKLYSLYLHYATEGMYKAGDINIELSIGIDKIINQYRFITDRAVATHLTNLAIKVGNLNDLNKA